METLDASGTTGHDTNPFSHAAEHETEAYGRVEVKPRPFRGEDGPAEAVGPSGVTSLMFTCPACGTMLGISAEAAGQPVRCGRCSSQVLPPQLLTQTAASPMAESPGRPRIVLPHRKTGTHGPLLPSRRIQQQQRD
ncbi:MAG: hypothetical protein KDK99_05935 [Verrucomicrobiales bacterium]|nr:hypothetical protein [Verrucomicrobiales bacterium]